MHTCTGARTRPVQSKLWEVWCSCSEEFGRSQKTSQRLQTGLGLEKAWNAHSECELEPWGEVQWEGIRDLKQESQSRGYILCRDLPRLQVWALGELASF